MRQTITAEMPNSQADEALRRAREAQKQINNGNGSSK